MAAPLLRQYHFAMPPTPPTPPTPLERLHVPASSPPPDDAARAPHPILPKRAKRWRRTIGKALAAVVGLAAACALSLESYDRLGSSSPEFALIQLQREFTGDRSALEREAKDLLAQVSATTGIGLLSLVRVGLGDGLSAMDYSAQFNPTNFRISMDASMAKLPRARRRAILLHEIGHAVAFSIGARPLVDLGNADASAIIEQSLLSNQIFQESFADAFATAWALRANPADSIAWASLAQALASPQAHASPAHETSVALRLLKLRLKEARSMEGAGLPRFVAGLASQASALTIAQLGAEREAACHMGLRGLTRFALDMGYESFYLPWEMAQTYPIAPQDPMAPALSAIANLRGQTTGSDAWTKALARARPAIDEAMSAVGRGANPEQASQIAWRGMALGQQDALPRELDAVAFAAKLSAASRSGWRAKAASAALELSESLLPAPTYGCSTQMAQRALGRSSR